MLYGTFLLLMKNNKGFVSVLENFRKTGKLWFLKKYLKEYICKYITAHGVPFIYITIFHFIVI